MNSSNLGSRRVTNQFTSHVCSILAHFRVISRGTIFSWEKSGYFQFQTFTLLICEKCDVREFYQKNKKKGEITKNLFSPNSVYLCINKSTKKQQSCPASCNSNCNKPFGFWMINTPYLDGIQSTECRGANFNWMRVWRLYTPSHHCWTS